jgi:hypothetical protein
MPQAQTQLPHEADHIRSLKHHGATSLENLCWACALCNGFKGSDIATYIPETTELTRLFNPRLDHWHSIFLSGLMAYFSLAQQSRLRQSHCCGSIQIVACLTDDC